MVDVAANLEPIPTGDTADIAAVRDPFVATRVYEILPFKTSFTQGAIYVNRVWDTVAGAFVRWSSSGTADAVGANYPGPGVFGVSTSDYCVESIR